MPSLLQKLYDFIRGEYEIPDNGSGETIATCARPIFNELCAALAKEYEDRRLNINDMLNSTLNTTDEREAFLEKYVFPGDRPILDNLDVSKYDEVERDLSNRCFE